MPGEVRYPIICLDAIVAIPVRNERERIVDCLNALEHQAGVASGSFGVVLFLNNCTDDTRAVVDVCARDMKTPVRLLYQDFDGANAGWARRNAMDAAAAWLAEAGSHDGCILTTDADSRVGPTWIRDNLAAIARGVDAVAGRIVLEPAEAARLPAALHARGALEGRYESLLVEIFARLDREAFNPFPNHWTTSGATLAVRRSVYLKVGGMPPVPVGEDRAFIAAVRANGGRVRHAPDIEVVTSGRLDGRAAGGAADTMKLRCLDPEALCDARLETVGRAVSRICWRRYLRFLHARDWLSRYHLWASALGIEPFFATYIAAARVFDRAYADIEAASARLRYRALPPRALPRQIRRAEKLLFLLKLGDRFRLAARRGDSRPFATDVSPPRSHPTFE